MASWLEDKRKLDLKICSIIPATQVYDMLEMAEAMLQPGQKHTFVIENFRVDDRDERHKSGRARYDQKNVSKFQWSDMQTSQMIGALRYAARRMNNSEVVMQEPGVVLGAAKRWAPFKWPKGHLPDDKSAYCHLAYWAMKRGLIDTTDDILKKGQEMLW